MTRGATELRNQKRTEATPMLEAMLLGYALGLGFSWAALQLVGAVQRHVAWRSRRRFSDGRTVDDQILA